MPQQRLLEEPVEDGVCSADGKAGGWPARSAYLLAHPGVLDCAVIGLPDDKWGERVTAVIQAFPGQQVASEDVRAFVKDRLGSVKTRKQVEVWPDLPRSRVGKVLRSEVRSRLLGTQR